MANPIERVVTALRERVPGLDTAMTVNERVGAVGGGPASSAIAMNTFLSLFPLLLVVRTSGEYRISNFLLWELAYSELVFTDVLWPDFRRENLYEAIREFQRRDRRFGSV